MSDPDPVQVLSAKLEALHQYWGDDVPGSSLFVASNVEELVAEVRVLRMRVGLVEAVVNDHHHWAHGDGRRLLLQRALGLS